MEKQLRDLEDEFLDLKLNQYIPHFRNEYNIEYTIIFELISLFNAIEEKFAGKSDVGQNRYLLSAIVELDKLFQSAVLMFERGLPRSGNIIIRTILELSLNIIDIVKNKSHIVDERFTEKFSMYGIKVCGECNIALNSYSVAVVTEGNCIITDGKESVEFKKGDKFFLSDESRKLTVSGNSKIIFCCL